MIAIDINDHVTYEEESESWERPDIVWSGYVCNYCEGYEINPEDIHHSETCILGIALELADEVERLTKQRKALVKAANRLIKVAPTTAKVEAVIPEVRSAIRYKGD